MRYIKIQQNENGSHNNQFGVDVLREGWAIIPEDMTLPSSFPFVDIEVNDGVVVSMSAREVPTTQVEKEFSTEEITLLTLADHEERLCLIELGVNE